MTDPGDLNTVVPSILPPPGGNEQQAQLALETKKMGLRAQLKSGANWFYWIAGLTLVNTLMAFSGSNTRFLAGLIITQVVDEVAKPMGSTGHVAALLVDGFIIGLFILFGVFANKNKTWAFLTGLILFMFDTFLLFLAFNMFSILIHALALWGIFNGYRKLKELQTLEPPPRQGF